MTQGPVKHRIEDTHLSAGHVLLAVGAAAVFVALLVALSVCV